MSRSNARDDLVKWPGLHSFFFMDNHSPATASKVLPPAALVSARLIRRWETGSLFSNSRDLTSLSSTRAADRPMWGRGADHEGFDRPICKLPADNTPRYTNSTSSILWNTPDNPPIIIGCFSIVLYLNGQSMPVFTKKNTVTRTVLDVAVLLIGGGGGN